MPRIKRVDAGGFAYHVLNRGNGRMRIFEDDADFAAFERVLAEALSRYAGVELIAYCLMPNHWHLVLYTRKDGVLSPFVRWLTLTHTQRWHAHRRTIGGGHVYQGRFKSFVIQCETHLATVCRYVERNALRAKLVRRAEAWRWSSLWRWLNGNAAEKAMLSPWPVPGGRRPANWLETVQAPQSQRELEALRTCANRGQPMGEDSWRMEMAKRYELESTFRPRGRPGAEKKL